MKKDNSIYLFAYVFLLFIFNSCANDWNKIVNTSSNNETIEVSMVIGSDAENENEKSHEDDKDYVWDSSNIIQISLNENSISSNGAGITIDGCTVTITSTGNYRFKGSLLNGQILVDTEESETIRLILDGANITNASSSPIFIKNAAKVIIVLADGSENYLTDGSSYILDSSNEDEPNATLFSKDDLTIYGNGSLTIDANYNDGEEIHLTASDDGLNVAGGTYSGGTKYTSFTISEIVTTVGSTNNQNGGR